MPPGMSAIPAGHVPTVFEIVGTGTGGSSSATSPIRSGTAHKSDSLPLLCAVLQACAFPSIASDSASAELLPPAPSPNTVAVASTFEDWVAIIAKPPR